MMRVIHENCARLKYFETEKGQVVLLTAVKDK